jgi:hypothetical protein
VWSSSPEGACGSHAAPSRSSSPVLGDPRRRQGLRAAACPPCFCVWRWEGGIGGSHTAPWRRSSQVGACGFGHFCIWGFVFEQAFGHAFLNFGIWGFLTEQTRLLAAVVVAPPPRAAGPCAGGVALKTASPCAGGATRGDGCSDEG